MAHVPPFEMSREEIRDELNQIRHPFRIAVDRAKNPFNIGSIVRTAHSFLAKEIILIGSEPWYERAAMGMQRYENIVEVPTVEAFLQMANEQAWRLIAFEKDDATESMWDADIPEDAVLVFGNEDDGIARPILDAAETVVAIPMFGINHSYPISIAAGVGMAEWARRWRGPR
ncbi:MAG: TrmH family RNA methyltransferase [Polyangiales bacterium]